MSKIIKPVLDTDPYIRMLTPNRQRVMVFARAQSAFGRSELVDVRPIRRGEEDLPTYGQVPHSDERREEEEARQ